jgi:hypothetical protein
LIRNRKESAAGRSGGRHDVVHGRLGKDEIFRLPVTGGHAVALTSNGGMIAFESADGESI